MRLKQFQTGQLIEIAEKYIPERRSSLCTIPTIVFNEPSYSIVILKYLHQIWFAAGAAR